MKKITTTKVFALLLLVAAGICFLVPAFGNNNYTLHDSSPLGGNYPVVLRSIETTDSLGGKTHLPQYEIAPISVASTDTVTSTTNANGVITLAAAGTGLSNVISHISVSYSAAPTGGTLKIQDGATVVWGPQYILAGGLIPITFNPPIILSANTATVITATAGGGSITETVSVVHKAE